MALALVALVLLGSVGVARGAPLDDARRLLAQGKAAQARQVVSRFLEAHPGDREGRFLLANILAQQGQLDAGYKIFHDLVAEAPDDPIGTTVRRLFRERGATAADATRLGALFATAQGAVQAQQPEAAIAALEEAVKLVPDNLTARNNLAQLFESARRYPEAVAQLEAMAKLRPGDRGITLRLAIAEDRAGRVDDAIRDYETVLRARPRDANVLTSLGRLYLFDKKDFARSVGLLEKAVEVQPNRVEALFLLGVARNSAGDVTGAIDIFKRVLAVDPTYFRAHFELGKLYETAGREREALEAFQATAKYGGKSPEAEQSRRRIALFGTSPEVAGRVRTALDQGVTALDAGDLETAKADFELVLSMVPGNTLALYNLATVYTRQGDNDAAIDALKRAIASDETHFLSHYGLALIYAGAGRFEEAYVEYKQVVRWSPPDSPYHAEAQARVQAVEKIVAEYASKQDARRAFLRANELAAAGKPEEALAQYKQAISLDPDNAFYHYNAGIVEGELGKFGDAFRSFLDAVRLKPDHVQSHFRLGLFYSASGFPQEAIDSFRAVIRYGTTEPEVAEAKKRLQKVLAVADAKEKALAYLLVGNGASALGEGKEALFAFQEAHKRNPRHLGIMQRLTETLMALGRSEEALAIAREGLEHYPEDVQLTFDLGQIQAKIGDRDVALKTLRKAATQAPDNADVRRVLVKTLDEAGLRDEAMSVLQEYVAHHPDDVEMILTLGRRLRVEKRPAEAAALYDWYLSSHAETTELLLERGLAAVAVGAAGVQQPATATGTALAGIVTGTEGVAGTPKYRTATEWFERAIAIAGPDDKRFVQVAQGQLSGTKRLRMNLSQTVIDYNSNGNNSATAPKTGVSSNLRLSGTYTAYRARRVYLPVSLTTSHYLHYTFQTYVNTNTLDVQLPTNLEVAQVTPEYTAAQTRTQRGRSSRRETMRALIRSQLSVPKVLTVDYRRTNFTSFTNRGNNYVEGRLDTRVAHVYTLAKGLSLNGDFRYFKRVLDAVALSLDSDRTDITTSVGLGKTLAEQRSAATSVFYTTSEDVRPANIRPGSTTGEVVPIVSHTLGANGSYNFRVYPTVTGVLSGSYSVTTFTQGLFTTFPGTGGSTPVTVESRQTQTSLSFGVTFTYRPNSGTNWVLDIRQVEARASQDIPANVEDILTNQVVQDNINKRKTFTLTMNYAF